VNFGERQYERDWTHNLGPSVELEAPAQRESSHLTCGDYVLGLHMRGFTEMDLDRVASGFLAHHRRGSRSSRGSIGHCQGLPVPPSLSKRRSTGSAGVPWRHPSALARVAGALAVVAGIAVLLGWILAIPALTSVLPGLTRMSPLTALTFALTGAALWIGTVSANPHGALRFHQGAGRGWFGIGGAAIALIGLYRLCDYGFGWNLDIDQLGLTEKPPAAVGSALSLMAPATACGFLLLGCALLLVPAHRFFGAFQTACLLAAMVAWLGFSHYIYGGEPLLPYTKMAFHTAMLFLLVSAGILCTRADEGLVALLRSDGAGGGIARRLVPAAIVGPVVLGWLGLEGERAGLFDTEAGVSLFALSNIIVFGALIWANAESLDRADLERRTAQRRLRSQLERLRLLQQITHATGERQDLSSIFQVVVRTLEDKLPVDFGCVCLYDPVGNLLTVTSVGVRSKELAVELAMSEEARIEIDENGLARCVRGQLVYEPDLKHVQFPFPERLVRGGLRSLVTAPLLTESRVFGVLVVARREPHSFNSADCEFLLQLSEHTALAAHQAQLYGALQGAYDDLRQTQQVVMQQERLRVLGQMASGVAHDINNSISPVALYTEALLENEPGLSERARNYLQTIQQAVGDVAETVGRMREFYRERDPETVMAPVHLNRLVQQVVDLTRARWSDMARQQGIEIRLLTDLAPRPPSVMGLESEIRDALTNLIFNAVDAMPRGGTLTLRTKLTPGGGSSGSAAQPQIAVEIADTGTGMDEATRAKCLEPFFTTKGERGTGLGLAMVYGMIQRHRATIDIESEVGKGTTMRLVFPVAGTQVADSTSAQEVTPPLSRLRILLVDDDPLLLESLREILEGDGHAVVAASGGQEGIDSFRAGSDAGKPFAVVITDLGMPHVDGRQVASAIKATSAATPVILLTGWGRRLAAEGDAPPHVDCVLAKPPRLAELRAGLYQCCAPCR
jgi:signal transduction histidine kinase